MSCPSPPLSEPRSLFRAAVEAVAFGAAEQSVVAASAADDVLAPAAVDRLGGRGAVDAIGKGGADDRLEAAAGDVDLVDPTAEARGRAVESAHVFSFPVAPPFGFQVEVEPAPFERGREAREQRAFATELEAGRDAVGEADRVRFAIVAADQGVRGATALQEVRPRTAAEFVGAGGAEEEVVALLAVDFVIAAAANDLVGARATLDEVVAAASVDAIVASARPDLVDLPPALITSSPPPEM